jgi:hypothetical protein
MMLGPCVWLTPSYGHVLIRGTVSIRNRRFRWVSGACVPLLSEVAFERRVSEGALVPNSNEHVRPTQRTSGLISFGKMAAFGLA